MVIVRHKWPWGAEVRWSVALGILLVASAGCRDRSKPPKGAGNGSPKAVVELYVHALNTQKSEVWNRVIPSPELVRQAFECPDRSPGHAGRDQEPSYADRVFFDRMIHKEMESQAARDGRPSFKVHRIEVLASWSIPKGGIIEGCKARRPVRAQRLRSTHADDKTWTAVLVVHELRKGHWYLFKIESAEDQ